MNRFSKLTLLLIAMTLLAGCPCPPCPPTPEPDAQTEQVSEDIYVTLYPKPGNSGKCLLATRVPDDMGFVPAWRGAKIHWINSTPNPIVLKFVTSFSNSPQTVEIDAWRAYITVVNETAEKTSYTVEIPCKEGPIGGTKVVVGDPDP